MAEPRKPDGDMHAVRRAACEGLAEGARQHLPGAIGILSKGGCLCVIAALATNTLDADAAQAIVGAAAGAAAMGVRDVMRRIRS